MSQPKWKMIANLGDADPIQYGGYFIFVDLTGVYPPEAEHLEEYLEAIDEIQWEVHRFILEKCSFKDGVLSDNKFHPECPAWWAKSLDEICSSMDVQKDELIAKFCSDDIEERAWAYRVVGDYFGYVNLDQYPLILNRREVWGRYTSRLRALKAS